MFGISSQQLFDIFITSFLKDTNLFKFQGHAVHRRTQQEGVQPQVWTWNTAITNVSVWSSPPHKLHVHLC